MENGVHRQWNTAQYPDWNFDFILTMANGDVGVSSSKKKEGNYKVGEEYTYDKETDSQNRTKLKKVKSLAAAAAGGNYGGGGNRTPYVSHYDNPDVQHAITKKFAMEKASMYLANPNVPPEKVTVTSIVELSDAMFAWCYNGIDMSSKVFAADLLNRRNALDLAVTQIPIKVLKIMSWKELAARADVNAEYLHPAPIPVPEPNV